MSTRKIKNALITKSENVPGYQAITGLVIQNPIRDGIRDVVNHFFGPYSEMVPDDVKRKLFIIGTELDENLFTIMKANKDKAAVEVVKMSEIVKNDKW